MQKMVSYDYKKFFYISGHIPGTIRGGGSYHFFLSSYDNYDKHIPGTIRGGDSRHFFLLSYDNYDKHIPGTTRGGKSFHVTFYNRSERLEIKTCTDRFAGTPKTALW